MGGQAVGHTRNVIGKSLNTSRKFDISDILLYFNKKYSGMKKLHQKILIALVLVFLNSFYQTTAQQLNLSLTPYNYNGYNISCFGNSDGSINLTISGGIPPYQILWSTSDSIEDIENLPAGYYNVRVTDSDSLPQMAQAEITLTEPRQIKIGGTIHTYPNGFHISVNGACNGIVELTAEYGVAPYSWLWSDSSTSPNRTSLCAGWYGVLVLDANGCKAGKEGYLKEPPKDDWLLTGNEATDPYNHFLGTIDSTDFSLRTNNLERLRVTGDGKIEFLGDIKVDSASTDTIRMVFVDQYGFLRTYGPSNPSPIAPAPDWNTKGNGQIDDAQQFIGTLNGADLVFKTATSLTPSTEKMRITQDGLIGIGTLGTTLPPVSSNYKLIVNGKVGFREAYVKLSGTWPDYVFSRNYKLKSLGELQNYISLNHHLPGMPKAAEIESNGQNLGEIQRLQQEKIEELYLYIIEMNESLINIRNENRILMSEIKKLQSKRK